MIKCVWKHYSLNCHPGGTSPALKIKRPRGTHSFASACNSPFTSPWVLYSDVKLGGKICIDERIKRKAIDFLTNVLTLCSPKEKGKTHSFLKPRHSRSKSPKLSGADWNVASARDSHHASEASNLELLAVQPENPDAPLSDTECHLQGFLDMRALGEHKAFQVHPVTSASWVVLDLFTEEPWSISKPVYVSILQKSPPPRSLLQPCPGQS